MLGTYAGKKSTPLIAFPTSRHEEKQAELRPSVNTIRAENLFKLKQKDPYKKKSLDWEERGTPKGEPI